MILKQEWSSRKNPESSGKQFSLGEICQEQLENVFTAT